MAEYEIFHVVVAPPATIGSDLIEQMVSILGEDPYKIRLLLSARIPKIVAQHQTMQAAESNVQRIRALGLAAFICSDSELRKPPKSTFETQSLKITDSGVTFLGRNEEHRIIETAYVLLILTGTRMKRTVETTTSSKMKLNLPATLVTGGIPIYRRVKEEKQQISTEVERFIRIYGRISSESIVEISQFGFDYSFLGKKTAASSFLNLNATVAELRKVFPQAAFDDRLKENSDTDLAGDHLEINCRLIYLYYRTSNLDTKKF